MEKTKILGTFPKANEINSTLIGLIVCFFMTVSMAVGVESSTCLDCHEDKDMTLAGTPHQLASDQATDPRAPQCAKCHIGAEKHIEDPDVSNILNPGNGPSDKVEAACTACHNPHQEAGIVGYDPHFTQNFSCTDCHTVHGGDDITKLNKVSGVCGKCHTAVVNQFRRRSNHPLTAEAVTCINCHDFKGRTEPTIGHGGTTNCTTCHPEQAGPFAYEHNATISFSPEGEGCTGCHQPHGSPNERLLNQSGNNLCRQCHGVPPLHKIKHDGIGAQFACIDCHSEIHGSHFSWNLLDQQLEEKIGAEPDACYCHKLMH